MTATENAIKESTKLVGFQFEKWTTFIEDPDFNENDFINLCEMNSVFVLVDVRVQQLSPQFANFKKKWNLHFEDKLGLIKKQNELRYQWLLKILSLCEKAEIPVILLKGSMVGACVAPFFSYKKMNDIDVLIHLEDGPRFISLIKELGFKSVGDLFGEEDFSKKSHHTPPYYSADMMCMLGIHWQLCSPYARWKPKIDSIWKDKQKIKLGPAFSYRMSFEHNLVHMCFHLPLFKTGLRELQDIVALIELQKFDWDRVFKLSQQWSVGEPVYRVLSFCQALLASAELKSEISNKVIKPLEPFISKWIKDETNLRLEQLLYSRSTHIAKIEKAYSISVLSKDPLERIKAWAATWMWTFFAPSKELDRIVLSSGEIKKRLMGPLFIIRAMSMDYGIKLFIIITLMNVVRAFVSFLQFLLFVRGPKILDSQEYKMMKMLE